MTDEDLMVLKSGLYVNLINLMNLFLSLTYNSWNFLNVKHFESGSFLYLNIQCIIFD